MNKDISRKKRNRKIERRTKQSGDGEQTQDYLRE